MRSTAFIVAFMVSTVPAFAHHGGGTFDLTRSVTYMGKLTRVELVNPHSWLYFDVTDAGRARVAPSVRDALRARIAPIGLDQ